MAQRDIRIQGGVVTRPRKPWTPTVHSLLKHLERAGLPVPRPLGYDAQVERVSLVPGEAGDDAWNHASSPAALRSAGALLRRVHDATASWGPPPDAGWAIPSAPGSVVCHGDPQPGNFAWRDGAAVGLFDWDQARPGGRVDDIAYALLWMVPVAADEDELIRRGLQPIAKRRARAEALLEGYGWDRSVDVVEAAIARHMLAIDEVEWLGRHGHEPHRTWCREGWPERWRRDASRRRELGRGLGVVGT